MRKVKALWNILSDAGRSVAVVGWWATWPAEPVRGAVVSDHTCYHFLFPDGGGGGGEPAGITYPADAARDAATGDPAPGRPRRRPTSRRSSRSSAEELVAPVRLQRRPEPLQMGARHGRRRYQRIGIELWQREHPDVLLVYIEGTDSVAHLFGHLFRAQGLAGELAAQQAKFGGAVEAMYRYADQIVGRATSRSWTIARR